MRTFDIYEHPQRGRVAVKRGFSWPAFLWVWIWAFVMKLWGWGFFYLGVMTVLGYIQAVFEQDGNESGALVMFLLQFVVFVWFGSKGNEWKANKLTENGYRRVGSVTAATPEGAVDTADSAVVQPGSRLRLA